MACLTLFFLAGYGPYAYAQATAASQTTPTNTTGFGVGGVSGSSFKFGEYNGLQNSGPFGIGNFDLYGGGTYDSNSAWRWHMQGTDLGLETRTLSAEFGKQGKYRFFVNYAELLANRSDTYQTPYLGVGTTNLTLPSNWLFPALPQASATRINFRAFDPTAGAGSVYNSSGVLVAPTLAQLATMITIRAADLPDFQNIYLYIKRTQVSAGVLYDPSTKWNIPVSFKFEHRGGLKALGAVAAQVAENSVTLPLPIDFDTTEANAAVNYKFKYLNLSMAYYGSYFVDNKTSVTWQDVANPTKNATLANPPSNQFSQLTFLAAEKFKDHMKLVVSGSYGRGTQNDPFLGPSTASNGQLAFGLPVPSLDGLLVTSMVHATFTAEPTKKWNLTAAYKYFNRDNQTPVHTYLFQDVNETKSGASPFSGLYGLPAGLGSNTNIYQNRAYSEKNNQANAEAEYEIAKKQWIAANYEWEKIDRTCPGAWIDCADARSTNEHSLGAEWHKTSIGSLTGRAIYSYSWRRGAYNEDAFLSLVPMANQIPTGGASQSAYSFLKSAGLTAFGPVAGLPSAPLTGDAAIFSPNNNVLPQSLYGSRNNINEYPGFRRYMAADRNRHKAYLDMDWQATSRLSLHGNSEFNDNDYVNSAYGLKKDVFWEASLDAGYAATENLVVDVFYTYDNQRLFTRADAYGNNSPAQFVGQAADTTIAGPGTCFTTVGAKNASAKIDPCTNYNKSDRDKIDTLGFSFSSKNLLAGKLELSGQFLYTRARTDTTVAGGSYVNNPLALAAPAPPLLNGTAAVFYIPAANYPTVRDDEITVAPTVQYVIKKMATLKAFYVFQKMMSSDWSYLGMQYGTGAALLPSNEQAPNYSISAGGLSLVFVF